MLAIPVLSKTNKAYSVTATILEILATIKKRSSSGNLSEVLDSRVDPNT